MMAIFARHTNGNGVVNLSQASEEATISRRYLEQLVIGLKNGDLIRGRSGRGGGYELARPADEIKIREIIEAVIGQINVVECVLHPEVCHKSDTCEARLLYLLVNERITSLMDDLTLDDFVRKSRLEEMTATLDTGLPVEPVRTAKHCCD